MIWPTVTGLSDGQSVNAETLNVPIYQLSARTNWLYQQVTDLVSAATGEATKLLSAPLTTSA